MSWELHEHVRTKLLQAVSSMWAYIDMLLHGRLRKRSHRIKSNGPSLSKYGRRVTIRSFDEDSLESYIHDETLYHPSDLDISVG